MCQMHLPLTLSCDGEDTSVLNSLMSHCRENLLALMQYNPYRKPTQVVEASSLR